MNLHTFIDLKQGKIIDRGNILTPTLLKLIGSELARGVACPPLLVACYLLSLLVLLTPSFVLSYFISSRGWYIVQRPAHKPNAVRQ